MTSLATDVARTIGSLGMRAAILLGTALAIAPTPGFAEMQVRGSPEAVRIEARDAPVEEILAALSRAFGMHYQLSTNLDKRLSGTYVGSLRRVLTRILDGYNFVLKTENGSTVVTVLGTPSATAAAPVSSGPKVVRQPAGAAPPAQPPAVVENLPRPAASTAAPSPAVELAQVPASPTPVLPESGAAPSPVPEVAESGAPAPAPPAPGSKPSPTPELTPSTGAAPPVPAPTRLLAPQRAQ